ncbi:hypothetical protein QTP88_002198 [Uroleucon formosanum]
MEDIMKSNIDGIVDIHYKYQIEKPESIDDVKLVENNDYSKNVNAGSSKHLCLEVLTKNDDDGDINMHTLEKSGKVGFNQRFSYRSRPTKIEFPTSPDGSGYPRKFSSEFYFKTVRSGVRIPRLWLCYSVVLDCVYCETCWLFASRLEKFKNNWIVGINDWHHIGEKISVHEISKQHIQAVEFRNIWSQNKTIDSQLESFFEFKKHGAIDHENLIYEVLKSYNQDIQNCRGQGYDGASVMSGAWSGVQQRISSTVSNAPYVHCCAHNLNLVICDTAKSTHIASNFFTTIQSIYNFF